ncbi:MAG: succinyl-diaminopimelate desuccinylase [Gammaproteobacteria bacterium]|nr:succinyl-diaminopimelate desuccinylase [Gammaproteobacteria bacterium]
MTDPSLDLAKALIARPSVTPDDRGCQALVIARLKAAGFDIEEMRFGEVSNLWATHGAGTPLLVFAGHTDVVPSGPVEAWTHPPFSPTEADGYLYGRGAADMKSSLAAMITAMETFVARRSEHSGTLGVLFTSDEEGPATNGTVKVVEALRARGVRIDYCVVGEPTSRCVLGDTVKNGRRGSLGGSLTIHGVQGHVAYPEQANNPIHGFARAVEQMLRTEWDEPSLYFPATTFQITNVHAGTGATNVVPGTLHAEFNLRFSSMVTPDALRHRMEDILHDQGLEFHVAWTLSGMPYLTERGRLTEAVVTAVRERLNVVPEFSTGGGTSDGRFIAPTGAEVVELGPVNETVHRIDERIRREDPARLSSAYERIMDELLT